MKGSIKELLQEWTKNNMISTANFYWFWLKCFGYWGAEDPYLRIANYDGYNMRVENSNIRIELQLKQDPKYLHH